MNQKPVEREVHQAFINLCQTVLNEHGLRITSVYIDWLDVSSGESPNAAIVGHIEMTMTSKPE